MFVSLSCFVSAQQEMDSLIVLHDTDSAYVMEDTTYAVDDTTHQQIAVSHWHPDANRAVWLGAIVPGLGQIYNRSYWKLPIVYGGLMGCAYAITINQSKYDEYKLAYRDILMDAGSLSQDPLRSYNAILPKGYTIQTMGGQDRYTTFLNNNQNKYRRYRDYSILATVIVYALSLIDAYVDAQLFDFDISPDLSLNVEPQIYQDMQSQRSAEVKLAISF